MVWNTRLSSGLPVHKSGACVRACCMLATFYFILFMLFLNSYITVIIAAVIVFPFITYRLPGRRVAS